MPALNGIANGTLTDNIPALNGIANGIVTDKDISAIDMNAAAAILEHEQGLSNGVVEEATYTRRVQFDELNCKVTLVKLSDTVRKVMENADGLGFVPNDDGAENEGVR